MTDVFEEVEENLRREQYIAWLRRYGIWLGLALVLLLAGVGGWQAYQAWRDRTGGVYAQKLQDGQKFFQDRNLTGAQRYYEQMAKDAPAPYKGAALEMAAEALYDQGDAKTALARLDEAAAASQDKFLRDAAKLKAAYIAADLQDYKTVLPRLNALVDAGGPLAFQAREIIGAKAYEAGEVARAREEYTFLSLSLEAPTGVRERARSALAMLGPAESAPAAASAGPPAAAPKSGASP